MLFLNDATSLWNENELVAYIKKFKKADIFFRFSFSSCYYCVMLMYSQPYRSVTDTLIKSFQKCIY